MNASMAPELSPLVVFVVGIIQLALLVWIIAFPIIIINKLNRLIDLIKNK